MKTRVHAHLTFYGFFVETSYDFETVIEANSIPDFQEKEKKWLEEKKSEVLEREENPFLGKFGGHVGIYPVTYEAVE